MSGEDDSAVRKDRRVPHLRVHPRTILALSVFLGSLMPTQDAMRPVPPLGPVSFDSLPIALTPVQGNRFLNLDAATRIFVGLPLGSAARPTQCVYTPQLPAAGQCSSDARLAVR